MAVYFQPTQIYKQSSSLLSKLGIRIARTDDIIGMSGKLVLELVDYQNSSVIETKTYNSYTFTDTFSVLFDTFLASYRYAYARFVFYRDNGNIYFSTTPAIYMSDGSLYPSFSMYLRTVNNTKTSFDAKVCCSVDSSFPSKVKVTLRSGDVSMSYTSEHGINQEATLPNLTSSDQAQTLTVTVEDTVTGNTISYILSYTALAKDVNGTNVLVFITPILCSVCYSSTEHLTGANSIAIWARGLNVANKLGILTGPVSSTFKTYLDVPRYMLTDDLKDYLFIFYRYRDSDRKLLSVVDVGKR